MGNVIKLLLDKRVKEMADIYMRMHTLERCEDFHLHWRNLRLIFNKVEFDIFCKAIMNGYGIWNLGGRKDPEPGKSMPEYLHNSMINPVHGRRPADFMIEVQGDLPHMPPNMIHVHYKSIRLDLSHNEFVEIAEGFAEALKEFKKWKAKNE